MKRSHDLKEINQSLLSLSTRCYAFIDQIPPGYIITYKDLAQALGTKGYRAVGRIVGLNPNPPVTPCHRVVCSDGRLGGYSAKGGIAEKIRLLAAEGIAVRNGRVVDFERVRWLLDNF